MRRAIVLPFLTVLLFSLIPIVSAPSPSGTVVWLDPAVVEFGYDYCVGETFTVACKVDNVRRIASFGFKIAWNTSYLEYVSHILKVPIEDYPDGLIYEPIIIIYDDVNETEGWYLAAVSNLGAVNILTGSGTAFEITFRVKHQPVLPESDVNFRISFKECGMLDPETNILHTKKHCDVIIHAFAETFVRMVPDIIGFGPEYCVGENFTLTAMIDDVEDLIDLSLRIKWNTYYLKYVSHRLMMPVELHPDGILHEPILIIADAPNVSQGIYDCAVSSPNGPSFNGSGAAFEITFQVKHQPQFLWNPYVSLLVKFTIDELTNSSSNGIPHITENCRVLIHGYTTIVKLDPSTILLGPASCIGDTFTLSARVETVEGLAGIGLQINWNTTYFEYVDHTMTMPVEYHSGGLLHNPIIIVANMLNEEQGTYDCCASTLGGGPFKGNGTAFNITLRVKHQPVLNETDITTIIRFTLHDLATSCCVIPHLIQNCNVTFCAYHYWSIADINKDFKVDISDIILACESYGSTPEEPNWNPLVDVAPQWNKVDILDLVTIAYHYGETYLP